MTRINRIVLAFVAAIVALLAVAFPSDAAAPNDYGIQQRYGTVPLTQIYGGFLGHATVAASVWPATVSGNNAVGPFRSDMHAVAGGSYLAGVQTIYPNFSAQQDSGSQGQVMNYFGYARGKGRGNALFANGVVECYNGGEQPPPDSTSECSALGEFASRGGIKSFSAAIIAPISAGATHVFYGAPILNEDVLGARILLNASRVSATAGTITVYTSCLDGIDITVGMPAGAGNSACPVHCPFGVGTPCTVIDFSGSSFPYTSNPHGWFFKSKHQVDNYSDVSGCAGDDMDLYDHNSFAAASGNGVCVGHWYYVDNMQSATRLTLATVFDSENLDRNIGSPDFLLEEGTVISQLDPDYNGARPGSGGATHKFTIPSNSFNWQIGDVIYSPPPHIQAVEGLNLELEKEFLTGGATAPSAGIRIFSGGQPFDHGIQIVGNFRAGMTIGPLPIRTSGPSGVTLNHTVGVKLTGDMSYLFGSDQDGSYDPNTQICHNCIPMGASANSVEFYDGSNHELVYSGSSPVRFDSGVSPTGAGLKHKRFATVHGGGAIPAISAASNQGVQLDWPVAFSGTNYTVTCNVEEATGSVSVWSTYEHTAAHVSVMLHNNDGSNIRTPTAVDCVAIQD